MDTINPSSWLFLFPKFKSNLIRNWPIFDISHDFFFFEVEAHISHEYNVYFYF